MQIKINGELEQLDEAAINITRLLEIKNVESPDMVSVQLNGEIVDRELYSTTGINDNDELDFLYFMGGGASPHFSQAICCEAIKHCVYCVTLEKHSQHTG